MSLPCCTPPTSGPESPVISSYIWLYLVISRYVSLYQQNCIDIPLYPWIPDEWLRPWPCSTPPLNEPESPVIWRFIQLCPCILGMCLRYIQFNTVVSIYIQLYLVIFSYIQLFHVYPPISSYIHVYIMSD